MTANSDVKE